MFIDVIFSGVLFCVCLCIFAVCLHICLCTTCAWCLGRLEEDEGCLGAGGLNLGPLEEKPMLFYRQAIFSSLNFFPFLINYIYSFILYPDCSFPSFFLFSPLSPSPILSSVSVQKEASHGYQQTMAYQVAVGISSSFFLRLGKATQNEA